jgi:hypothetical protein
MTKVIDGVRVLEFDEWHKKPSVIELENEIPKCEMCDDGEHECECGDTHDCGRCHGTGKEESLKDIYTRALKKELEKLLAWREGLPIRDEHKYKRVNP